MTKVNNTKVKNTKVNNTKKNTLSEQINVSYTDIVLQKSKTYTIPELSTLYTNPPIISIKNAKNIDMSPRQSFGEVNAGGLKVRVLGEDSNDFKFKIKKNK